MVIKSQGSSWIEFHTLTSIPGLPSYVRSSHQLSRNLSPQEGRALDLPVYFGDAGSPAVLHALRAEKAACAVITLDTPGACFGWRYGEGPCRRCDVLHWSHTTAVIPAILLLLLPSRSHISLIPFPTQINPYPHATAANYRSVWALHKHFPLVKTFVRAHDVENGALHWIRAAGVGVVSRVPPPRDQVKGKARDWPQSIKHGEAWSCPHALAGAGGLRSPAGAPTAADPVMHPMALLPPVLCRSAT